MNKSYRLIFNKARGMLMAVAETATAVCKGGRGQAGVRVAAGGASFRTAALAAAGGRLRLGPLTAACLLQGVPYAAQAGATLPQGGVVVGGQATFSMPTANQLLIKQATTQAAINWQSFNIGAGDRVQFLQPSSTSQVLNRVIGLTGSAQILGNLTANGQVYIVDPQGVVFGRGAVVDVGALLASTNDVAGGTLTASGARSLTLAGAAGGSGLVQNEGTLSAKPGGWIVLLGDQVQNDGTLSAPAGTVALLAGGQATLALANGQLVGVVLNASQVQAALANSGNIQAVGGQVILDANSASALLGSAINLSGLIDASGAQGGRISVDAGANGTALLNGATLDAYGAAGSGGNVTITGQHVALTGTTVNASGATGGGTVLVGGGPHGADLDVRDALTTVVDPASTLTASASREGDGGTVVLWSQDRTLFGGTILARGGDQGGNGGWVETSSHGNLAFLGHVDTRAPEGRQGNLLLDPDNIVLGNQPTYGMMNWSVISNYADPSNITIGEFDLEQQLNSSNVLLAASQSITDQPFTSIVTAGWGGSLTFLSPNVHLQGTQYGVGGGLVFNVSGTAYVQSNITGTGGLTQSGSGTTILEGANSYSGNTTVTCGTLQVGSGLSDSTLGNGSVYVTNASLTIYPASSENLGSSGTAWTFNNANLSVAYGTANLAGNSAVFTGINNIQAGPNNLSINISGATSNYAIIFMPGSTTNFASSNGINISGSGWGGIQFNQSTVNVQGDAKFTGYATSYNAGIAVGHIGDLNTGDTTQIHGSAGTLTFFGNSASGDAVIMVDSMNFSGNQNWSGSGGCGTCDGFWRRM